MKIHPCTAIGILLGAILSPPQAMAGQHGAANVTATNLADLSIEQLVNLEVNSVSKRETRWMDSPAAVAVLTGEDIRQMGALSLAEALRAVPGMDVARINANDWAVSSRGFNDQYANKLLVLMDGRAVYTRSFGGVYWRNQDLILDDLDRIEVIRGPGATLWGANAVNGVVNVMTKRARDTQGLLISTAYGNEEQPVTSLRYGGELSSNLFYRIYGNYVNEPNFADTAGRPMSDAWWMGRGGLRLDWEPAWDNTVTFEGEYNYGDYSAQVAKQALFPPTSVLIPVRPTDKGTYYLTRWTHRFTEESEFKLQAYYDYYALGHPFGGGVIGPVTNPNQFLNNNAPGERLQTWDVDAQHHFSLGNRQDIVWGGGYRLTLDRFKGNGSLASLEPVSDNDQLLNAFAQDEIALVRDRLGLTLGTKLERNDYTGMEVEPGVRLALTPTAKQTVWLSVARAIRTATRLERGARVDVSVYTAPPGIPGQTRLFGNPALESEQEIAYEAGYRVELSKQVSLDLAAYYNSYDDLIGFQYFPTHLAPVPPPPHLATDFTYANVGSGHTYGAEAQARWQATEAWRLTAGYTWLRANAPGIAIPDQASPQQQFNLRSSLDLGRGLELDTAAYFVDRIKSSSGNFAVASIPAYVRLDLGLVWKATRNLELSVWGQNLLDNAHPEFGTTQTPVITENPRTLYGQIKWRF